MGYRSLYLECEAQPREQTTLTGPIRHRVPNSALGGHRSQAHPLTAQQTRGIRISPQSAENHSRWEHGLLIRLIASVYPCFASILSMETALSDFPHSRQTRLARGVISPQNGHILCDRTSWPRGRKVASNFPRNSRREARRRRRGGR
jgi:hypothetical protein